MFSATQRNAFYLTELEALTVIPPLESPRGQHIACVLASLHCNKLAGHLLLVPFKLAAFMPKDIPSLQQQEKYMGHLGDDHSPASIASYELHNLCKSLNSYKRQFHL